MFANTLWHDLKWSLFLGTLALAAGLLWQWPLLQESWQGSLSARLEEMEKLEAARRLEKITTYNLDQVYKIFHSGQALFIDARSPEEYQELHIEGAKNLTAAQLKSGPAPDFLQRLEKQQHIVVYCGQVDCHASLQVAELLQSRGFTRVAVFLGGFRAWDEAGFPVDISR